jgi:glycosyltransferase involved in cell wall biosynthesis
MYTERMSGFVSCIVATCDRPRFLAQALKNYSLQTCPDTELIVVDDGQQSVADLCAEIANVRHIRLTQKTHLGTKMNIGIEAAKGDILQKLDDDDYYGPDFLSLASERLNSSDNPCALVAWCCFAVLIAGQGRLFHSGHGWQAGGTLRFHRELWKQNPFRDIASSEDSLFIKDNQPEILRVCAADQYMLVRHGANTWKAVRDHAGTYTVEKYFSGQDLFPKSLGQMAEPRAAAFYRSIMQQPRD